LNVLRRFNHSTVLIVAIHHRASPSVDEAQLSDDNCYALQAIKSLHINLLIEMNTKADMPDVDSF